MNINSLIKEELQDITNIMSYRPDGFDSGIVDESYDSIQGIKLLASDIIKEIANYNYEKYSEDNAFDYIYGIELNTLIGGNDYGKNINSFIARGNVGIRILPKSGYGAKGSYSVIDAPTKRHFKAKAEREITVYYNYDEIKSKIEEKLPNLTENDVYFTFYNSFSNTLLHELQHFYDDFISQGQFKNSKRNTKYFKTLKNNNAAIIELVQKVNNEMSAMEELSDYILVLNNKDNFEAIRKENVQDNMRTFGTLSNAYKKVTVLNDVIQNIKANVLYLRLPYEINARYIQAIDNTSFYTFDLSNSGKLLFKMHDIHDVVKNFIRIFGGYKAMTPKQQWRIIKRVAQYWHYEQNRINELNETKQNRLNEDSINEETDWDLYEMRDEIKNKLFYEFLYENNTDFTKPAKWYLIPENLVKSIWEYYIKFKEVRNVKGLDLIERVMTINTLKISLFSELGGRTPVNPDEDFDDAFDQVIMDYLEGGKSYNDNLKNFMAGLVNEDNDVQENLNLIKEELKEKFWYYFDYGHSSDYGTRPLEILLTQLRTAQSDEQKLIVIDKMLNVIHQTSDLAANFLRDGSAALSRISGYQVPADAHSQWNSQSVISGQYKLGDYR